MADSCPAITTYRCYKNDSKIGKKKAPYGAVRQHFVGGGRYTVECNRANGKRPLAFPSKVELVSAVVSVRQLCHHCALAQGVACRIPP